MPDDYPVNRDRFRSMLQEQYGGSGSPPSAQEEERLVAHALASAEGQPDRLLDTIDEFWYARARHERAANIE